MKLTELLRYGGLAVMLCAAAIVPALTMGGNAVADPLHVGDPAPELHVSQWVHGGPLAIKQPGGHIFVVIFWATYCPPCRDTMPFLSRLQTRHAADGVHVVCIGHESREKTEAYLKSFEPHLPLAFALDNHWITSRAYLEGFNALGIPYAAVIDGEGQIAWHGNPISDGIEEALEKAIDSGQAP